MGQNINKMATNSSGEVLYVGVGSPNEVRRGILESMKEVVKSLKSYDGIRAKRVDKVARVVRLQKMVLEIDFLFSKLKRELPRARARGSNGRNSAVTSKSTLRDPKEHLEEISAEVHEIEQKLARLR